MLLTLFYCDILSENLNNMLYYVDSYIFVLHLNIQDNKTAHVNATSYYAKEAYCAIGFNVPYSA